MNSKILVSAVQLNELIENRDCVTVDCRYDFSDAGKARADWLEGHIPGACYAHLDLDLASPIEDHTGRHPLPETMEFLRFLSSIGWSSGTLLVAYDEGSGAMASRLWWLMRYYGQAAALLDGGLAAWSRAGFSLEAGAVNPEPKPLEVLVPRQQMIVDTLQLQSKRSDYTIVDARAAERFSGEVEMLDTRAGHIPGAINRPLEANLGPNGRFKSPSQLRLELDDLLGDAGSTDIVHSCGSGVTACHNLFAMELAGYDPGRLYPGSWSEWIRDPDRPIELGE